MDDRPPHIASGQFSFSDLREWLASFPDQVAGKVGPFTETSTPYMEFFSRSFSRPDDVTVIEVMVARDMQRQLEIYFNNNRGKIHWRIPLETEVRPAHIVLRYDENGPDMDYVLDKRCHTDKNWRDVAAYCRLYYEVSPQVQVG
mgnify:FL=1